MSYNSNKIEVLKGLEAVRKRPGMYIGDTNKSGLHHLIWEILHNSVDEAMGGHATEISIHVHKDGETITISDDGRGIPVDIHPTENKSALEVVMTVLHAGGKMSSDSDGYIASGGLHGVGASCVNALSDSMTVDVYRDGYLWRQTYSRGNPTSEVLKVRPLSKSEKQHGTETTWHPDHTIFRKSITLDPKEILKKAKEIAYLNKSLKINYSNDNLKTKETFCFDGGISDYILDLSSSKNGVYPNSPIYGKDKKDNVDVEFSILWNDGDDDCVMSYINNIHTFEGGTHLSGFKTALTRTINKIGREKEYLKEKDENLEGKDISDGIISIVSVRLSQPELTGQTKSKLVSTEAESAVSFVVTNVLTDYFSKNPKDLSKIVQRAQAVQKSRKAAKDISAALKKKTFLGQSGRIPDKLRDCRSSDLNKTELFIVEGDSAAGSATLGRDSEFQAILAIKGKIINAEKNDITSLLKNEEVGNLMTAIGTGIKDDFDIDKLKYGKIIIMSDADDDGFHIRTLLLAFFYRYMKPLIENGHVYIAQPPLYMIEGKTPIYCWDEHELKRNLGTSKKDVKRFKGLGEMDAEQLEVTTMEKQNRKIVQIKIENAEEAEKIVSTLMGKDIVSRKEFLSKVINK